MGAMSQLDSPLLLVKNPQNGLEARVIKLSGSDFYLTCYLKKGDSSPLKTITCSSFNGARLRAYQVFVMESPEQ